MNLSKPYKGFVAACVKYTTKIRTIVLDPAYFDDNSSFGWTKPFKTRANNTSVHRRRPQRCFSLNQYILMQS